MYRCFGKKEICRVLVAHAAGMITMMVVVCVVMMCRKKRTPADKLKRAFKELEQKLEV